ncbi:MAG: phosphoserine phosphatase SerB [Alphaproteobacteria bacterium]|nr:phosphoserine phosphatase SerB [Alphaproteobacteria bacterium]
MKNVITCVAAQKDGDLIRAALQVAEKALNDAGITPTMPDWLAEDKAADIRFESDKPSHINMLRENLQVEGVDIFIQPDDAHRKKRLLVADMDATILQGETIDDMAADYGIGDKIAPITARAMRGEIEFAKALEERMYLFKGMPLEKVYAILDSISYTPGAEALVKTMTAHGHKCMLVSGGFDIFTVRVAETLGFWKNFGNTLGMDDTALTGVITPPLVDKQFKKDRLLEETKALGLETRDVIAVGDGANDIPMLQAAGVGVGFHGKPAVQAATPFQVRYGDLTALLYLQGYGDAEAF